jgi:hypothetical protein
MEDSTDSKIEEVQEVTKVKKRKISPYHNIKAHSNPLADKDFP